MKETNNANYHAARRVPISKRALRFETQQLAKVSELRPPQTSEPGMCYISSNAGNVPSNMSEKQKMHSEYN